MKVTINIARNQMQISNGSKSKRIKPIQAFSTPRLVVGDFNAAQQCLEQGAKDLGLVGFMKGKHDVRIEVNDYFGDGISPVERKIFQELAHSCFKVNRFEIELVKNNT